MAARHNTALKPTLNLPRFSGHLHQTTDEVSNAKVQEPAKDLAVHE